MSLKPHEKRVLAGIENTLCRTDPELATMLATFTVARRWKIRRPELRWRPVKACLTTAVLAITAGLVLWGLLSIPARQQLQCASQRQGLPGLTFAACGPVHGGPASGSQRPEERH
jgi:hypothetical protein